MIETKEVDAQSDIRGTRTRLVLPPAPSSEQGPVKAWSEAVEMITYETAPPDVNPLFLEKRVYQGSSGRVYPLPVIDRVETTPIKRTWRAFHIENESIRVMILPELGGRIHVAMDKRNGYDFVYRQNVIKPALVGLAGPWISGGIEFNWPQHHRPATFMPTESMIERAQDGSVTVWCSDHDPMERMKGMHGVCLHPGKALMEVRVRLYNRTLDTHTFLWWANVATHVNERYQSFFPEDVQFAADHAKRAITTFPISGGTYYGIRYGDRAQSGIPAKHFPAQFCPDGSAAPNDLTWYANIPVPTSYMIANSKGDFSGGYDHKADAGTVAVGNHHISPGKKQWTWGNHEFGYAWDRSLTDSDGPYVELMVGTYTDNQPDFSFLAPGETKSFSQFWYPLSETGVPNIANLDAAMRVERRSGETRVHLQVTSDIRSATIEMRDGAGTLATWNGDLSESNTLHHSFFVDAPADYFLEVRQGARLILRYAPAETVMADAPGIATPPAMPAEISSADELYLTGVHLEQYRHPTRTPEIYWEEAVRRDPGDSRCNAMLGRWHLRRGEFHLAEKFLRTAVKRMQQLNPNPPDGEPFYNLGLTLMYIGDLNGAYDAFYKATWNAAWAGPGYHRIAEIDCRRKQWSTALEHINASLKKDCENLNALALKAMVLERCEDGEGARKTLVDALSLDPLDIFCRSLLKSEVPKDGQQCLDLCFDLMRSGFEKEALGVSALATLQELNLYDGSCTMLLYLRAQLEKSESGRERAQQADWRYVFPHRLEEIRLLETSLAARSEDAHAHLYLGNLLYDKRRHSEAIEHWERCSVLQPDLALAWRNLAIGYFNQRHDADAALRAFHHARMAAPFDPRLLYEFDQLQKRTGTSPKERLALLQAERTLVHERDDLSVEMASLLTSEDRPKEAIELLLSRKFQPWEGGEGMVLGQFTRAHVRAAIDCLALGRSDEAVQLLHGVFAPPESLSEAFHVLANVSEVHFWLGIAYRNANDAAASLRHFEIAASDRSDFQQMQAVDISENSYWSAKALQELGRDDEARQIYQQMIDRADEMRASEAEIDFFATSLPTMLLFEESLQRRVNIQADFLEAQARIGLKEPAGEELLRELLQKDRNHIGAIDLAYSSAVK